MTPIGTIEISLFAVLPGAATSAPAGCRRSLGSGLERLRHCSLGVEQKHIEDTNKAGKDQRGPFANRAPEFEPRAKRRSNAWFESSRQHHSPGSRSVSSVGPSPRTYTLVC